MFQLNQDYLMEEVSLGGGMINKSGYYTASIVSAEIREGAHSDSECLSLTIETSEGQKAWFNLYYKNRSGEAVAFNERHITHLCYLTNTDGKAAQDKTIPGLINKQVGVALEVKTRTKDDGSDGYDFQLVGFFHAASRKTAKEQLENKPAEVIQKVLEKYQDAVEVTLGEKKQASGGFGANAVNAGYYPIPNNEIPFK